MSVMLYPNVLWRQKENRTNKELEEHFNRMKQAEKMRMQNTAEDVSKLSDEELIQLEESLNENPANDTEEMMWSIIKAEYKKRLQEE